jgi:hypothetical protein
MAGIVRYACYRSVSWECVPAATLLLVMLYDFFAAHVGDVRILSRVASRAPLAEEIPVLVEAYGDFIEALAVVFGQSREIAVLE